MTHAHPATPRAIHPEQPWFVLSAAQHYHYAASSHPAISHFYSFTVAESVNAALAIPDGCVDIVIDCDAPRPAARVCGTTLAARSAELVCGHRYFGVRFAPGVTPDFLDLVAGELVEREFSFLDVAPDARPVLEQIMQQGQFSQQVALFTLHFTHRLMRKTSPVTALTLHAMDQQKGNIRIDQLEGLTGYTCRTIQRQFRQDTGMSPKTFCRILRCQSALNTIHRQASISFSDLALDLGFSDQSHFLREFKRLVSATPVSYQRHIAHHAYAGRICYN
ncbi:helix-turn-helix domain-containing protein [Nissabacter sp. SGAir0207]|uniref:AraC family transcriptional regulator n=1 Tax=Nissabacter sp. SGAir0207 TaxID=2126321 RepID=UPI0010CCE0FF|nr:helix-turn-helix domain-containing protein [Nissabacter sp. SGAir0207]QCR38433.1 AraC family transcriptional regulator [Nissabacter sp. SGAir0207]